MNIDDLIIYNKTILKRESKYVDFPSTLSEELCDYLSQKGITKLYCHQAEMFENYGVKGFIKAFSELEFL